VRHKREKGHVVSHGHVLSHGHVWSGEHSSSQYPLFRVVASATIE
jgi:hypothetical protein